MRCINCDPPCSYKEENPSGVCPFNNKDSSGTEKNVEGCCPMFERGNFIIRRYYFEDELYVFGKCVIGKDALVDCHHIIVHGDLIVERGTEIFCLSLEVFGNLIIKKGSRICIEGDDFPIIHGKIRGAGKLIFD